ncbi:MAG TPA: hypothetical protein VGG41_14150 [Solirubrobacteraceae bacterium]|jgi:hypothetical protein
MARTGQGLGEQLAGAAGESGGGRRSKRRGRFVKVIVLGGVVAIAIRPQVRNRLLDALFGPEEQFDYESLTEPSAPAIDPDDLGAGWPSTAGTDADEEEGPSWTFTNETDWGAAIAPVADAHARTQEESEAAPPAGEEEPAPDEGPLTAFGVTSSVADVAPASPEEAAPYQYDSREEDPPTPGAYAPSYEPPASVPIDEPAYEPPPSSYEPPAEEPAYEPSPAPAYEPPAEEPASEPPPAPAYEPPSSSANEPSPYDPPAALAYEPPSHEPAASSTYEPPATPAYEPPPSTTYDPPAPFQDDPDLEPQPAEAPDEGHREYDWGVPASESPVRPVPETAPFAEPEPQPPVEASWEPASDPVHPEGEPGGILGSADTAGEQQGEPAGAAEPTWTSDQSEEPRGEAGAEESSAPGAGEDGAPEPSASEGQASESAASETGSPEAAAGETGVPESPAEDHPSVEPAIGEAGPPPRGGWWLSRRRRGSGSEPPRWD